MLNNQLNTEAVLTDLGIEISLASISIVEKAKALVILVRPYCDNTYDVPTHPEGLTAERLSIGRAGVYCSCDSWRVHHCVKNDYPMADPQFLCVHGAAALLRLDKSSTYSDWKSVQCLISDTTHYTYKTEGVTLDEGVNRRAFFGAMGKRQSRLLAKVGLDRDMVVEAYRRRFGVSSLTLIGDREWAIAAAEMQAAVRDDSLLVHRASEIKTLLSTQ